MCVLVISKFWDFHPLSIRAHEWCVCLPEHVWPIYVCVFLYAPCVHLCVCRDPYLHSASLFILPFLLMVQRRIQCCWLFRCHLFHMQPPPLLTLPLMLDHRWKSSSHPADAFRFWWVFLFNSQGEKSSRTSSFIDGRENMPLLSFQCSSPDFFTTRHFQFAATGLKKKKEGRRKAKMMVALTMKKKLRRF